MKTYYAPTFLDESRTHPNRKGVSLPTGILKGIIFTRSFSKTPKGKIKGERGIIFFSWGKDTKEAKAAALKKAIDGMEELERLDENPALDWIPKSLSL